ncbi:Carbonic anhydrase [Lachnospiraceae bacterium TWA4]|nr:Carbonic anhydrase [Lachnospiraceae bacterium TWA4]
MYNEALKQLKIGNEYYVTHNCNPAVFDNAKRRELTEHGQKPYAIIVTCGDSRVPAEHLFSAGLGDLFVIRNAGNVISPIDIGSAEYAAEHLGTSLLVVLGHTHCGAVAATLEGDGESYIRSITDEIKEAIQEEKDPRKCEWLNAKNSVKKLLQSPILSHLKETNKLNILAGMYDIESGRVVFED